MRFPSLKFGGALLAAVLSLGLATEARAQQTYIEGAYSWAVLDTDDVDTDLIEEDADAYKIILGYEYPSFWGFELGYVDLGEYEFGEGIGEADPLGSVESSGWTVAITGRFPIGQYFAIFGKVGYFFWEADVQGATNVWDLVGDGEDPFYGAGLQVKFGQSFSVLGEYERFEAEELKSDLFSLGLRIGF